MKPLSAFSGQCTCCDLHCRLVLLAVRRPAAFGPGKYGSGPSHKTLYRSCLIQSGGPVEAPDLPLGATSRSASVPPARSKALGASFCLRRSCHGMTMPRNRWRSHWRDDGRVLLVGPLGRGADVHRGPLNNLKYDLTSSGLTWSRHAYNEIGGLGGDVTGRLAAVAGAIARLVRPQRKPMQVSLIVFIGSSSSCGVWLCRAYHGDERLDLIQSLMGAISELLRPEMPKRS
jgi:uncharacterized protein YbbK (DUF523 family)